MCATRPCIVEQLETQIWLCRALISCHSPLPTRAQYNGFGSTPTARTQDIGAIESTYQVRKRFHNWVTYFLLRE